MKLSNEDLRVIGVGGIILSFILGLVTEFSLRLTCYGDGFEVVTLMIVLSIILALGALLFSEL